MKKKGKYRILWWLTGLFATGMALAGNQPVVRNWMLYYGDTLPPERFYAYDLLVFDSQHHPLLSPLLDRGKLLAGYLSLGEVARHHPWFEATKREGLLLGENPNWPGSYFVDIRDPRWARRVVEELVPFVLRQGFHGLMLDTLDNPVELERRDPDLNRGMGIAAAQLVSAIRLHYPDILLIQNRGYPLLEANGSEIDFLLAESLYSTYDFERKHYFKVPEVTYQREHQRLLDLRERFPDLKLLSLDYWDPDDTAGIAAIHRRQRADGFLPLVGVISLDRIIDPTESFP